MIQIQLMFKTAEEAIVALAKLSDGKAAAIVAAKPVEIQVPGHKAVIAPLVEKKERKPRSDKDKKREPYGPREANANSAPAGATVDAGSPAAVQEPARDEPAGNPVPDASSAGAQPVNSTSTPAAAVAGPAPVYPTEADAQKAMEALFAAKQLPGAMAVLSGFKVNRVRDLKPEQRKDFIDLANAAAAR